MRLKGINKVTRRLADGTVKVYYYAWRGKGAPLLEGEPGSPTFVANYNRAVAGSKDPGPARTLLDLLNAWQRSGDFGRLAPRTRADYAKNIRRIESHWCPQGDAISLTAVQDDEWRRDVLEWRDEMARASPRQADYTIATLLTALNWAEDRRIIARHPLTKLRKLYRTARRDCVWTPEAETAFLQTANPAMQLAYILGAETGMRQGDLLGMTWGAYDGTHIRIRQRKTGAGAKVEVVPRLRVALESARKARRSTHILTNGLNRPWKEGGFHAAWRRAKQAAGVEGLTFHDLRGTFITRRALEGWPHAKIAAATGHKLGEISSIIDCYYLSREALMEYESETDFAKRTAKWT